MADGNGGGQDGGQGEARPGRGKAIAAAGAGVLGGAGVSTAVFSGLGIRELLANPETMGGYAIAILCAVCLFALVAGFVTLNLTETQSRIAFAGMAVFGLVMIAGALPFVKDGFSDPKVAVRARFRPDVTRFKDPDTTAEPVKLQFLYYPPGGGEPVPFDAKPRLMTRHDMLDIEVGDLQRLEEKYLDMQKRYLGQTVKLNTVCETAGGAVCGPQKQPMAK